MPVMACIVRARPREITCVEPALNPPSSQRLRVRLMLWEVRSSPVSSLALSSSTHLDALFFLSSCATHSYLESWISCCLVQVMANHLLPWFWRLLLFISNILGSCHLRQWTCECSCAQMALFSVVTYVCIPPLPWNHRDFGSAVLCHGSIQFNWGSDKCMQHIT